MLLILCIAVYVYALVPALGGATAGVVEFPALHEPSAQAGGKGTSCEAGGLHRELYSDKVRKEPPPVEGRYNCLKSVSLVGLERHAYIIGC